MVLSGFYIRYMRSQQQDFRRIACCWLCVCVFVFRIRIEVKKECRAFMKPNADMVVKLSIARPLRK